MNGARRNTASITPISEDSLKTSSESPAFTCHIPIWTPGKPVLTMYSGDSTEGAILGTADLSYFSCGVFITIGDPSSNQRVDIDMKPSSVWTFNGFEISLEMPTGQRLFSWKRTKNEVEVRGLKKWDGQHLKLVDMETGEVVAKFTHHTYGWSKRGVFEIEGIEGVGRKKWDEIVVLTGMAVLELQHLQDVHSGETSNAESPHLRWQAGSTRVEAMSPKVRPLFLPLIPPLTPYQYLSATSRAAPRPEYGFVSSGLTMTASGHAFAGSPLPAEHDWGGWEQSGVAGVKSIHHSPFTIHHSPRALTPHKTTT
ncbi:hypothetical protein G7Y89_g3339 [Cudoniella acicularis]|uniref:Uncharacterized protein n=1 Tax=Cudoniella acicularis TaxID=354080 RepID=A0A8H4RUJ5_9HELO|nr:hypothetical protein G7Y89_g3339 [Cudoniella acicularis]